MYDNQTVCWRLFKSVKALVGVIVKSPKHSFEALLSLGSTKSCTRVRWWTTLPQTSWLWHRRLVTRESIALSIPRNSSVQINVQMQVSCTLRGIVNCLKNIICRPTRVQVHCLGYILLRWWERRINYFRRW